MKINREKLKKQMDTISVQKKMYFKDLLKLAGISYMHFYKSIREEKMGFKTLEKLENIGVDIDTITIIE